MTFCDKSVSKWQYARRHADLGFYCIDGARWMLFARDPELITLEEDHFRRELEPTAPP